MESTKVKELETISVDMKEVDNVNDQIEVSNVDEYTKTTLEDEDKNRQRKRSVLTKRRKSGLTLKEFAT